MDTIKTLKKPSLNKHIAYGFVLSFVIAYELALSFAITSALAIPIITSVFQIRLAKYNIKQGKPPKKQWRSAILTIFLVFAIVAIVVVSCSILLNRLIEL
jgi:membrane protein CcdC involved in cytochrome C biogenesis